jgi:hypothetical protein
VTECSGSASDRKNAQGGDAPAASFNDRFSAMTPRPSAAAGSLPRDCWLSPMLPSSLTAPSLTSSMFSLTPIANSFPAFGASNQSNAVRLRPMRGSRVLNLISSRIRRAAPAIPLLRSCVGRRKAGDQRLPMIRRGLPHKGHLRPELRFSRTRPIRPLAASSEIFRALPHLSRHRRPQHLISPGPAPVLGRPPTSMLSRAALGVW